jgi:hypothetical protein
MLMLKQRRAAAEAVRSSFLPAEHSQDQAAIQAARCLATALEIRASANLPLGTGLDAIAHLSRGAALQRRLPADRQAQRVDPFANCRLTGGQAA